MKLVIVESPHKSITIGKFLGPDYKVLASKGHIRDLASSGKMGLGVDIANGFKPTYVVSKEKEAVVKELKSALKKADEVYLATDPDREGEAISWHLAQVLGLDVNTTKRLEFHEITKPAILKAMQNPRTIDLKLVESQETRRIIDRLMGFRLSNLLQSKLKSRSAGRVQSVVLRYIVDREAEIKAFVPVEYWTIDATFTTENGSKIHAELSAYKDKAIKINNKEESDKILSELPSDFIIKSVKSETKNKMPNPPFTTATLQQAAFSQFHYSTKKTASIAQRLYEGEEIDGSTTGLITYMRTDSIRLADEFIAEADRYIENKYGKDYLGLARRQKADKNVQDAHEAIRPTNLEYTPEVVKPFLTQDEYNLYVLIYDRALASLMAPRKDSIATVVFTGNGYDFSASSTKTLFEGYFKVYGKYEEKQDLTLLPDLKEGNTVNMSEPNATQHFTKAPGRYNEGSIVKQMQKDGIGRPSTYAPTITNLEIEYVEVKNRTLIPTEQGILTSNQLVEYFPKYMDVGYTANMESNLDLIAEGKVDKTVLLTDFWEEFCKYFEAAKTNMEKIKPVEVGRNCPVCGAPLVLRKGRYGNFVGCSNYPQCNYIEKPEQEYIEGKVCPKCGGKLVKRHSKKGDFVGCANYPKCHYMEDMNGNPIEKEKKEIVIPPDAPLCPRCHTGHLIEKTSRFGKKFIACSNYPKCRYIQKDEEK